MDKWQQLDREYVVRNRWVTLAKDKVLLPNGSTMDDFYVFEKKNVSLIVALDEENNVLIKKEYRYPVDEFLYELPGGVIEEGNNALETAKRELLEETGYTSDEWIKLISGYDYPTKDTNVVNIFLAKNVRKCSGQKLEISEDIEFEFIPLKKAIDMCVSNEIKVNGTISGLMLTEKLLQVTDIK
ncbi:NUDIX domain-containing protein [Butyrivibrio sp. ob235]|uniref:NUDIX hydrolase n=2 Tax=unclassified Butyrivibrio TaxID=2639466 RepID=UPI0004225100|nr:NUDIX hydrolase [Butyrivibrio sp. ob235]SEL87142.1 NUDIX domain-containing protein [Butyrivibrio sp. ob235]